MFQDMSRSRNVLCVVFLLISASDAEVVSAQVKSSNSSRPQLSDFIQQELSAHFDYANPVQMAETIGYLKAIQRLAVNKFYGQLDASIAKDEDDGTIVSISLQHPGMALPISQFFFEGDVILTPGQARDIYFQLLDALRKLKRSKRKIRLSDRMERFHSRRKRKLYTRASSRWTENPISYTFHSSLDDNAKAKIAEGIKMWEENTCLRYEKVETGTGDYVQFFKGQGCYSMIGKVGGRQGISIGQGCESRGVIAHEMGHSLGLWHEQSRPDRDCCINILEDNIIKSTISNFLVRDQRDIEYKNTKFDVGSDMHYGPTAFTTDWSKHTIKTKLPGYQRTIGQRDKLSFYDLQIINRAYCQDKCSFSLTCYWGGYQHPGDCKRCLCPEGIGGNYCEKEEPSINAECGGEMTVRDDWREISSPGHPSPGYNTDQKCSWLLRAPIGKKVELQFIDQFQFWCTTTCMDYVEVKNSTDLRMTGMRFCCYEAPKEPVISQGNTMVVIFRSTISRDVGFKAKFKIQGDDSSGGGWVTVNPQSVTTLDRAARRRTTPRTARTKRGRWTGTRKPRTTPRPRTTRKRTQVPIVTASWRAQWGGWSPWGSCSESCGACGVKSRSRRCNGRGKCPGYRRGYEQCAFDPCPTEKSCKPLRRGQSCVSSYLEHCYETKYVSFKCTTHACCPPYKKYGETCALGKESRK